MKLKGRDLLMGASMNQDEIWAKEYLLHQGFAEHEIIYEPDGGVPPDFVLHKEIADRKIAVEVRRLNHHFSSDELRTHEPSEGLSIPLFHRLTKLLEGFGPSKGGVGWWVDVEFSRPQQDNNWEKALKPELVSIQTSENLDQETTILLNSHFKVHLERTGSASATFLLREFDDGDFSSGWKTSAIENNIALCVAEKRDKVAPYRSKYPEWWLILVDHIAAGIRSRVQVEHDFDKLIVISPNCYDWAYEVPRTKWPQ